MSNGVARVPCALGQEIFSRAPCQQKTIEFKGQNKCERAKTEHFTVVILVLFEGHKTHVALEMNTTKLQ